MNNDQREQFLKDEYLKLQDQYEDYDRRALMIKGWVGAGAIAAVALVPMHRGYDSLSGDTMLREVSG